MDMNENQNIRRQSRHTQPPKKSKFRIPKRIWITALVALVVPILMGLAVILVFGRDLPTSENLENIAPSLPTRVYSADGVLLKEFLIEKRIYVPLDSIPDLIKKSVLATEDRRFYDHWGIATGRFFKVTLKFLTTGSRDEGASTLSQQLARRLFLYREKRVVRKIKEVLLAIKLERRYTKDEIFEMYMNHLPFGYGTNGVAAAAKKYFNKNLDELLLPEYALLTGMLQRPAVLNPAKYDTSFINRHYIVERRNLVLRRMLQQNYISRAQYNDAVNSEVVLYRPDSLQSVNIAPYFTEQVRRDLYTTYRDSLYTSGMEIYTTLDSRVQACAERAVNLHLPEVQKVVDRNMRKKKNFVKLVPPSILEKRGINNLMADEAYVDSLINEKCRVQVAFVAIDPRNGKILAMIGGRNFNESEFNRAVQAVRQPGSVFKPFVYTAAVDNGYMPFYEKLNQPIVVHMVDGTRWTPHNYDGSIGGKTTMREALRKSLNLVTARLVQEDIPPEQVIKYARSMGITTPLQAVDAIALGAIGVRPIEIISAFGTFANKGVLVEPYYIQEIQDKYGNTLEQANPQSRGVLGEETAFIMADMLKTVAQHGTGAASRSQYNFYRPAGGKTGTTNDFTDAWYISFTPQIVAGVWVGLDDPSMTLGERQSGARVALPITAPFMKAAHDTLQLPVEDFERPATVVDVQVCRESQQLATDFCPDVLQEICDVRFLPKEKCTLHTGEHATPNNRRLSY